MTFFNNTRRTVKLASFGGVVAFLGFIFAGVDSVSGIALGISSVIVALLIAFSFLLPGGFAGVSLILSYFAWAFLLSFLDPHASFNEGIILIFIPYCIITFSYVYLIGTVRKHDESRDIVVQGRQAPKQSLGIFLGKFVMVFILIALGIYGFSYLIEGTFIDRIINSIIP